MDKKEKQELSNLGISEEDQQFIADFRDARKAVIVAMPLILTGNFKPFIEACKNLEDLSNERRQVV